MSRKKRPTIPRRAPSEPPPRSPAPGRSGRAWLATIAVALVAIAAGARYLRSPDRPPEAAAPAPAPAAAVRYVGGTACRDCHEREYDAWRGSHHDRAMQVASDETVLGRFDGTTFTHGGTTSTFFKRDDKFFVNTDGPDGRLADFELAYTFGVMPLQQYLIAFPDGRMQALSIAWDARPQSAGGQRWFHLYPEETIPHTDPLHWTQLQQNWNFMCADCHSTNVRKGYDADANRFQSTWSELNVACEACHGPGSHHLEWARREADGQRHDGPGKGLAVALDERRGVSWAMNAASGTPSRSRPRETAREIEACARCHARRAQISDDYVHGRPMGDTLIVSALEPGLYWPDGQMRDEVYNYGSFAQSRMFAAGVTCGDCHDPHSLALRAPGNAVCAQCHLPATYDSAAHHHHPPGSTGAACAACHMPTTTYMVIDPRHDHSLRIPRPDLSAALGTPDACTSCHTDQTPQWAAAAVQDWNGQPPSGPSTFGVAFAAAARHAPDARGKLLRVAGDTAQPAIVRASAFERLAHDPTPAAIDLAARALRDRDEIVRRGAVELLSTAAPDARLRHLPPMLGDAVRVVRIAAARALAALPSEAIPTEFRAALDRALDEYVAAQRFNADRPEGHANLGALYAERGELDRAEAAYRRALELSPQAVQPVINLADLYRARGDDARAEELLRGAVQTQPAAAALHHALGLVYARQKRQAETVAALAEAMRLGPDEPRYAYVYGVALHSLNNPAQGIAALEEAHRRFPGDRSILQALATMERDRGDHTKARTYAEQLLAVAPDDPMSKALALQLGGQPPRELPR